MTELNDLRDHASKKYEEFVDALREMVDVDCGSYTPEGVNVIADLCQRRFEAGGWEVERLTYEPAEGRERLGDLVIGRHRPRADSRAADGPLTVVWMLAAEREMIGDRFRLPAHVYSRSRVVP